MSDIIDLHKSLVEIPSCENIEHIREYIYSFLENHSESPVIDDAGNIIAQKGEGQPHYILNSHFDTVPPHIPYENNGRKIQGRGTSDAKGPLAVLVNTFVQTTIERGTLTLVLTPDEETTTNGAAQFSQKITPPPSGFIIGEPTNLDICTAAKGYFEGEILIKGEAAHSSRPEDGHNAIIESKKVIDVLSTFDMKHNNKEHPLLGQPILSPTVISGGDAVNQIPDVCKIEFSRRGVPPETKNNFLTKLNNDISEVVNNETEFNINIGEIAFLEPFETDPESRLVTVFQTIANTDTRPFTAATEASHFAKYDVPIVIFGPGFISDEDGAVAHSTREYILKDQLHQSQEILQTVIQKIFE